MRTSRRRDRRLTRLVAAGGPEVVAETRHRRSCQSVAARSSTRRRIGARGRARPRRRAVSGRPSRDRGRARCAAAGACVARAPSASRHEGRLAPRAAPAGMRVSLEGLGLARRRSPDRRRAGGDQVEADHAGPRRSAPRSRRRRVSRGERLRRVSVLRAIEVRGAASSVSFSSSSRAARQVGDARRRR